MGPSPIVTATPFFDHYSGFGQATKHFGIQAFLAECTVETFVAAVLPRLPRFDVRQFNSMLLQLFLECVGQQFTAIIAANGPSDEME